MPAPSQKLTPAQLEAAGHPGPLLVIGEAGSGRTATLVARCARLIGGGEVAVTVVALTATVRSATVLRSRVEDELGATADDVSVVTPEQLCFDLLRAHPREADLDPFAVTASHADRLALLLAGIDELPLRQHDLGGNTPALLARVIERIDALKEQLVGADDFARWAASLPVGSEAQQATAAREREFAELYRAHERLLAEAGALDSGGLLLRGVRLLRDAGDLRAHAATRARHLLLEDLQDFTPAQCELVKLLASAG
ncbi:MAG TPA: UvrD-helicase domain-containing protein, partial [Solirubrobacteraceae bacterium]|nr:UvrD-helicase domain-containing protein [Solirubrobacteraceae bacterium]